jgi:hypothetical protein
VIVNLAHHPLVWQLDAPAEQEAGGERRRLLVVVASAQSQLRQSLCAGDTT